MEVLSKPFAAARSDDAVDAMLGDNIDFARYIVAIWHGWWIVVGVAILCGGAAGAVAWLRPPVYAASAMLAVTGSKLGDPQAATIAPVNFRPLIENNSVAAKVIEELQLGRAPHFMTPGLFLRGALTIEEVRNSSLMRIQVTLEDPRAAANAVNRVADLAVEGARKLNQNEAVQARDEIEVELKQARMQLQETSARLEKFKSSAQVELGREDVRALLAERGKLLALHADIEAARARVKKGEAEIAARKRIDSLTRAIDADPALSQAARAAGESDKSILGLQLKSEEVNKAYEAIDEQLAKDRAGLAALEAQRAQLVDVRRVNAQHQPQLTAMFQKEAELARLTTDYEVAERSYKEIAAKYDVARLQVASRSAQLQVIDRASVPTSPEPRHLLRNTTFGILAAATVMVIAIILAQALRDALNRGTRSAG